MVLRDVNWMQSTTFSALEDRQIISAMVGQGIAMPTHFKVAPTGTGLGYTIATGQCFVKGTEIANQGMYCVTNDATLTPTAFSAAAAGQHRTDLVVIQTNDTTDGGRAGNNASVVVVAGGSVLIANSMTVPTAPASSIPLAEVVLTAGVTTLLAAHITNRRVLAAGISHVGSITPWMGAVTTGGLFPGGYLPATGTLLTVSAYPELYEIIGNTYGGTPGTNYNLPNLTGRSLVGTGTAASGGTINKVLGTALGGDEATLTTAMLPSHTHDLSNHQHYVTTATEGTHQHIGNGSGAAYVLYGGNASGSALITSGGPVGIQSTTDWGGAHSHAVWAGVPNVNASGAAGSGSGHANIPTSMPCNWLIRVS